jgi:hypothetical protein
MAGMGEAFVGIPGVLNKHAGVGEEILSLRLVEVSSSGI